MKKLALFAALLIVSTTLSASADRRNFWMLNNTGRKIYSLYIAAHGTDDSWGSDVLKDIVIPHGAGSLIYFLDNSSRCVYDFRIEYDDDSYEDYVQGRNLCQFHAIQFSGGTSDGF